MAKEFRATAQVALDMPRAEVWQRMRDLTLSKYYVPGLLDCRLKTAQTTGVGTSRTVYMKHSQLDETVIEWSEGNGFILRLHNGDRPPSIFSQASAHYRIEEGPGDQTLFEHSLTYVMRFGFVGALFARFLMHKVMTRAAADVARNLKQHYETGQPSNKAYHADKSLTDEAET